MSRPSKGSDLFPPEDLRRLERLRIQRRRSMRGEGRGEWRSPRIGCSGLFADHRAYVAGDDLRYVDWNVYGRLGDLVVKRFEAEEQANLLLCVDRSLSMAGRKAYAARRLAGALGHLALAHQDRVRLAWLPTPSGPPLTAYPSRARAAAFLDDLAGTPDHGDTDHVRDLGRILAATKRRGLVMLLSDFYDPGGAIRGLAQIRARGLDVMALHVIDPDDAVLPEGASVVAVDRETGESLSVDLTPALVERVRLAWRRRIKSLEGWCVGREIPYLRIDARRSLWDVLKDLLRAHVAVSA